MRREALKRSSLLDDAALDAAGAYVYPLRPAVELDADLLEIGKPPALRNIMRVTDLAAGRRFFSAYGAFSCHCYFLPIAKKFS